MIIQQIRITLYIKHYVWYVRSADLNDFVTYVICVIHMIYMIFETYEICEIHMICVKGFVICVIKGICVIQNVLK